MKPSSEASALYVYAVAAQDRLRTVFGAGNLPGGVEDGIPVALVTHEDLAAVVSEVPLAQFGEGRFEENLKDAAWAAERVMRHEKLAEFLAARASVIPLRFGVMYSTPDKIRTMLSERGARLREILKQLEGREEWGLSIQLDRARLRDHLVELIPRLAEIEKQAASAAPGQRYLLEKKLDGLRISESKTEVRRVVGQIRDTLQAPAQAVKDLAIRPIESKQEPPVIGKISFLIDKGDLKKFQSVAERLAGQYERYGFTMELTGPWPPYNFSE